MATVVVPEICTLRSEKAKQKVQGWTRKYFIEQVLKVARQTAYSWEELIIEIYTETHGKKFSDYLFDPGTSEAILIPGQPWNHHQMWVLKSVKKFMFRKPKPLREELKWHLIANADRLSHSNFFEEFNKNETQTASTRVKNFRC